MVGGGREVEVELGGGVLSVSMPSSSFSLSWASSVGATFSFFTGMESGWCLELGLCRLFFLKVFVRII